MSLKHDKDARIKRFDFENSDKPWGLWNQILGTKSLAIDWYRFLECPGNERDGLGVLKLPGNMKIYHHFSLIFSSLFFLLHASKPCVFGLHLSNIYH